MQATITTTNKRGDQLFKLLPPSLETLIDTRHTQKYTWHIGENPDYDENTLQWHAVSGDLYYAVDHDLPDFYEGDINDWNVCWVEVPLDRGVNNTSYAMICNKLIITRIATIRQLRETNNPVYRQLVAYLAYQHKRVSPALLSLTYYDWLLYLMGTAWPSDLNMIPEEHRTLDMCAFANILHPNNGILVPKESDKREYVKTFVMKDHFMLLNFRFFTDRANEGVKVVTTSEQLTKYLMDNYKRYKDGYI